MRARWGISPAVRPRVDHAPFATFWICLSVQSGKHMRRLRIMVRCWVVSGPSVRRMAATVLEAQVIGRAFIGYQ